ncbi:MAG: hypothetical protein C0432_02420 [Candidatus Puniceispirillum sp.]|nr:hypothetical protein [Candidatus Pelagibacter sp.]MBA4283130.1 hypothetical protein [Candidatus Puniceispirillum sp.]
MKKDRILLNFLKTTFIILLSLNIAKTTTSDSKDKLQITKKEGEKSKRKNRKKHTYVERLEHFKLNDLKKLQKKHDSIFESVEKNDIPKELKDLYKIKLEIVAKFITLANDTTESVLLSKLRKLKSAMFQDLYSVENKLDFNKYLAYVESRLTKQKKKYTDHQSHYSEESKKIFSFLLDNAEKTLDTVKKPTESTENVSKETKEERDILLLNQADGLIKETYNIPCSKCQKSKRRSKK